MTEASAQEAESAPVRLKMLQVTHENASRAHPKGRTFVCWRCPRIEPREGHWFHKEPAGFVERTFDENCPGHKHTLPNYQKL